MAIIRPFRGIRYDHDKVGDIAKVISQPYDRIRQELQERYFELSDHNITHIIKGRAFEDDDADNNVYTRARKKLDDWLQEGILQREDNPAIYIYHQKFCLPNGDEFTRKAFIAALELADFDQGIVLPHEKTHTGPKIDRLKLTQATEACFGNIFMLYPDKVNRIDEILKEETKREPDIDVRELHEKDIRQMLWVVTDADLIKQVQKEMQSKTNLIIADGHHRYETALNYRAEQREKYPDAPFNSGFNYVMAAFVSMSNSGLIILPTHRLLCKYNQFNSFDVLERAKKHFFVEEVSGQSELETKMKEAIGKVGCIGMVTQNGCFMMTLSDKSILKELFPDKIPCWYELDTCILHKLFLEYVMGINREKVDAATDIEYLREPDIGYKSVMNGDAVYFFFMNATRIDQVIRFTEAMEKMPQKSTDFYPKMVSGFAILPIGKDELL